MPRNRNRWRLRVTSTSLPLPLLLLTAMTSLSVTEGRTDVTTTDGKLVGFKKYVDGSHVVDTFYGIPYARPPVGALRFKPPVPATPWKGERSAKYLPNSCLQVEDGVGGGWGWGRGWGGGWGGGSGGNGTLWRGRPHREELLLSPPTRVREDCLYLNVWVPRKNKNTNTNTNDSLSTLVWLHGGRFASGSGSSPLTDGAYLAAKHDVIIVSVNYRLGVAGFFYTGRRGFDSKGNLGLLDQRLALRWVYNNVGRFRGGSRHDVTLFGTDSGAASAGFHLLSPKSWPYFSRAVLQSGSPLSPWALASADVMLQNSLDLAALAGCNQSDGEALMTCMRGLSAGRLVEAERVFAGSESGVDGSRRFLTPVVDGDVVGDLPEKLLRAGKAKPAAILIGVNQQDGVQTLTSRLPNHFPVNATAIHTTRDVFLNDVIPAFLSTTSRLQSKTLEFLYTDYVPPNHRPNTYYHASESFVSDVVFKCDVIKFAQAYYVKSDVYMYSFQNRLSTEVLPAWSDGAVHYAEVELLFGVPFRSSHRYSQQEMILSNKMMELWTNFAKFGSPNAPKSSEVWPRYDSDTQRHLVMDTQQGLTTETGLRHAQCLFLNELLPLMKSDAVSSASRCRNGADTRSEGDATSTPQQGRSHSLQSDADGLSAQPLTAHTLLTVLLTIMLIQHSH